MVLLSSHPCNGSDDCEAHGGRSAPGVCRTYTKLRDSTDLSVETRTGRAIAILTAAVKGTPVRQALTVRELVQETDFGLELVSEVGLDRVVKGIHLSDLEDPTPFMTPGMVLLTTGEAFAASPDKGLRLLDLLDGMDVAALGVGVGHYMSHVDRCIVAHAATLGVPVFEAPLTVPFRSITSYVYDALASADMHRLRRTLAVQGHLLDLMLEERGVSNLILELSKLLDADVMLLDSRGVLVAHEGPRRLAHERVWKSFVKAEGNLGSLGAIYEGQLPIFVRRVVVHGVLERVLAAAPPSGSSVEFVETALTFAQRLLVLERLQEAEHLIVRRRMRSLLLEDFLSEHSTPDDCRPRLEEQGIDLTSQWRIAVFNIDSFARETSSRRLSEEAIYEIKSNLINSVDRSLGEKRLAFLSSVKGDSVVSLIVTDSHPAEVAALLGAVRAVIETDLTPLKVTVGCSGPEEGLRGGKRRFGEAIESLTMAKEGLGAASRIVLFDQAGGRFRLIEGQSYAALVALRDRLIAPLEAYDKAHKTSLVRTLRVHLDNCMSPGRTAEALIVHRSTLRKRLRRIEQLTGTELSRMDDVVEVHLALRAAELLSAQEKD